MDNNIIITDHAFDRLKERSGLNKKAAVKLAEKAYNKGIKHSDTSGTLYRYVSSVAGDSHKGATIRLYGDKVFIFNRNNKNENKERVIKLITVMQMPNNIVKKANALRTKINNN